MPTESRQELLRERWARFRALRRLRAPWPVLVRELRRSCDLPLHIVRAVLRAY